MDDICKLCSGMGTRVVYYRGTGFQFWECQGCGGAGARLVQGPPEIRLGRAQSRFMASAPNVAGSTPAAPTS